MNYSDILNKIVYKSLKECSYDKRNNVFLVESSEVCIDFDQLTYDYCKFANNGRYTLDSVDSLIQLHDKKIYIEFKNGILGKDDILKIKNKLRSSIILCSIIFDFSCRPSKKNDEFILVYNIEKNTIQCKNNAYSEAITNLTESLFKASKKEYVRFGLKDFVELFGLKAHTFTSGQFENWISDSFVTEKR